MIEPSFDILYESPACLAVSKPSGLLTQAPPGVDSLELRVKAFLGRRDDHSGKVYLGVPHRLDRPASGAMVLGKSRRATRRLSEQFEERWVGKVYWACVEGRVAQDKGTWSDHLRKVPNEARAELVPPDHPGGRRAVLHYRVLSAAAWGSWLEIKLETGRTHQIRIQAASRGHSVLGDFQYGSATPFGPQFDDERLRAIALHARSLSFEDPKTREPICVTAPASEGWRALGLTID